MLLWLMISTKMERIFAAYKTCLILRSTIAVVTAVRVDCLAPLVTFSYLAVSARWLGVLGSICLLTWTESLDWHWCEIRECRCSSWIERVTSRHHTLLQDSAVKRPAGETIKAEGYVIHGTGTSFTQVLTEGDKIRFRGQSEQLKVTSGFIFRQ